VERPLKTCRINALAARSKELDQVFEMFSAPRIQRGGIIHAMPYSQEGNFLRL
jgi:hypothetical protein